MKIAFTIDYEDWYQGIDMPFSKWNGVEKRLQVGHYKLLELLTKFNVKATFFILGKTIEDHPELFREIIREGHEIACHSYSHPFLFKITPEEFREEIKKSKDLLTHFNISFTGFRAPYFSIDKRNLWALDIIKEEGFKYDSSVFPGDTRRTGIPGFNPVIHQLDNGLTEFPMSTFKTLGFDFGLGGSYFRILPYSYTKKKLTQGLSSRKNIFYIHPWELDPHHPKISGLSNRIRFTHYANLESTEKKVAQLLSDFECTTAEELLNNHNTH